MRPTFSFWDFEINNELEGKFIGKYPNVGPFKRGVFVVERKGGGVVHLWSFVQLNNLMGQLPFGTLIIIKYLGKKTMPDGTKYMFKDFSVEILAPPEQKTQKK